MGVYKHKPRRALAGPDRLLVLDEAAALQQLEHDEAAEAERGGAVAHRQRRRQVVRRQPRREPAHRREVEQPHHTPWLPASQPYPNSVVT
jgi:hypothetical protein